MSTVKVEQKEESNAIKAREESGKNKAKKRKKLSGLCRVLFFSFFLPFLSHKRFRTFLSIINGTLLKFKWASKTPEVLQMCGQSEFRTAPCPT